MFSNSISLDRLSFFISIIQVVGVLAIFGLIIFDSAIIFDSTIIECYRMLSNLCIRPIYMVFVVHWILTFP